MRCRDCRFWLPNSNPGLAAQAKAPGIRDVLEGRWACDCPAVNEQVLAAEDQTAMFAANFGCIHFETKAAAAQILRVAGNVYEPPGIRFTDALLGQMLLVQDQSGWNGWLCFRHSDGKTWVTLRKANYDDLKKIAALLEGKNG